MAHLFFIGIALALLACQQAPERRYDVKGIVVAVDSQRKQITVEHEDIPGYMDAMTMPFSLTEEWPYKVLHPGDQVQAALVVQGDRSWLEELSITRSSATAAEAPQEGTSRDFSPYPAANFTLTDQDGQPLSLSDLRGKIVILDFIFTRCPGPCPLLSLKFSQLQQKLGARFGKNVMLLSISIDPRHDTPTVLKEYAQRYSANLTGWKFLVGSTKDTIMTASAFGADYEANQDGIVDHRLVTCVIDREGNVIQEFSGTNYTVDEILAEIDKHDR
ncbi:MAG: redoxin domain-containing protein [Deltaproteobacteria bacterium]|nr:redoxin domain-containing protein [Deltaproteobacteria bacterium]